MVTFGPAGLLYLLAFAKRQCVGLAFTSERSPRIFALLYLPPYSPDLNPIELAFSKLKRLLRSAAARTVDALWKTVGQLISNFTANECANYLRHCGYSHSGR
jgi:transposase